MVEGILVIDEENPYPVPMSPPMNPNYVSNAHVHAAGSAPIYDPAYNPATTTAPTTPMPTAETMIIYQAPPTSNDTNVDAIINYQHLGR